MTCSMVDKIGGTLEISRPSIKADKHTAAKA
jgi:hypothetical protein